MSEFGVTKNIRVGIRVARNGIVIMSYVGIQGST